MESVAVIYIICAFLWGMLFVFNLVSDAVASRINYGIATALLTYIFIIEAITF